MISFLTQAYSYSHISNPFTGAFMIKQITVELSIFIKN